MNDALLGFAVAISGFLLALNLSRQDRSAEEVWLQGWLATHLAMSLCFLAGMHINGWVGALAIAFATSAPLLSGPFIWFYARDAAGETGRPFLLHAAPFLVCLSVTLLLLGLKIALVRDGALFLDLPAQFAFVVVVPVAAILLSLLWPLAALRAIARRREGLKGRLSDPDQAALGWVRVWAGSTIAILGAFLLSGVATNSGLVPLPLYIGFCLMAFCLQLAYVGYRGFRETSAFALPRADVRKDVARAVLVEDGDAARVTRYMADAKPYLEPGLVIETFSDGLGLDTERVSQILSKEFGETYFDFINRHRVEEVKRLMADPANARVTLLALALDAGFGSKSAFNEAFRRHVGMTPSAYRRSLTT